MLRLQKQDILHCRVPKVGLAVAQKFDKNNGCEKTKPDPPPKQDTSSTFISPLDVSECLRVEDDYAYGGDAHGPYALEDPVADFNEFLDMVQRNDAVPPWWDGTKRKECMKVAKTDKWANITYAIEKNDIEEHYDGFMPMRMRSLARKVYGHSHIH